MEKDEIKGFDLIYYEEGGFVPHFAGNFDTEEEAEKECNKMEKEYPERIWEVKRVK